MIIAPPARDHSEGVLAFETDLDKGHDGVVAAGEQLGDQVFGIHEAQVGFHANTPFRKTDWAK
jgi:hypothetical protein